MATSTGWRWWSMAFMYRSLVRENLDRIGFMILAGFWLLPLPRVRQASQ
jgi:hypothetical protein